MCQFLLKALNAQAHQSTWTELPKSTGVFQTELSESSVCLHILRHCRVYTSVTVWLQGQLNLWLVGVLWVGWVVASNQSSSLDARQIVSSIPHPPKKKIKIHKRHIKMSVGPPWGRQQLDGWSQFHVLPERTSTNLQASAAHSKERCKKALSKADSVGSRHADLGSTAKLVTPGNQRHPGCSRVSFANVSKTQIRYDRPS